MENKEISLTFKEYALLERSLRGDETLSRKLSNNQSISKNNLVMELLEEIRSFEYDEGTETPLVFRMYENGRVLLMTITEKLYPKEAERYLKYLSEKSWLI